MTVQTDSENDTVGAADDEIKRPAQPSSHWLHGSLAVQTRLSPAHNVDLMIDADGTRRLCQVKSYSAPGAQAEWSEASVYLALGNLVHQYATSRMPDDEAAARLTWHVLTNAERSLARGALAHQDLSAKVIGIAVRTANSWEDAARRAHAAPPPLHTAKWKCCQPPARTATHYPDPATSRAVVVGAGSTPTAPYLPEADRSAAAVADRLTGVARTTMLRGEQATREQVLSALENAAGEATDLLMLYVSGHGRLDEDDQFTVGTASTTLAFTDLYERTRRSTAAHMMIIVDGCTSGGAAQSGLGRLDVAAPDRDEYVITATGPNEPALARDPQGRHEYTAFTGALLEVLTSGVPEGGDDLDVATLYGAVDRALARGTLPRPHLYAAGRTRERWALAPNPRSRTSTRRKSRPGNRSTPQDAQLLADAAHGNQNAWDELVERYSRLVWSTARAFRLDDRECAEVFRDTWQLLICDRDQVEAHNLPRWLTNAARHRSLESLRDRAARPSASACPLCRSRGTDEDGHKP